MLYPNALTDKGLFRGEWAKTLWAYRASPSPLAFSLVCRLIGEKVLDRSELERVYCMMDTRKLSCLEGSLKSNLSRKVTDCTGIWQQLHGLHEMSPHMPSWQNKLGHADVCAVTARLLAPSLDFSEVPLCWAALCSTDILSLSTVAIQQASTALKSSTINFPLLVSGVRGEGVSLPILYPKAEEGASSGARALSAAGLFVSCHMISTLPYPGSSRKGRQ